MVCIPSLISFPQKTADLMAVLVNLLISLEAHIVSAIATNYKQPLRIAHAAFATIAGMPSPPERV